MSESRASQIAVTVVTYNSGRYIDLCLRSVFAQSGVAVAVVVVDNASTDGTAEILERYSDRIRVIRNMRNLGFAAAQNQAIAASEGDWVLVLNPDVVLDPGFAARLVEYAASDPKIGTACGRMRRLNRDLTIPDPPRIDTTGLFFTPCLRHFDRGWGELDDNRQDRVEYVFGASAAAALYRRGMIEQASPGGEFFDPDFFAYREDADVAWRAQLLGWRCLFVPSAIGYHVRSVGPYHRSKVPWRINMHSVKNRFLMRIKNMTGDLYRRHWLAVTARDLVVLSACLVWEPASLPAFWLLARGLRRAIRRRRWIMKRRVAGDAYLAAWWAAQVEPEPAVEGWAVPAQPRSRLVSSWDD